jgi:hypothetical protein
LAKSTVAVPAGLHEAKAPATTAHGFLFQHHTQFAVEIRAFLGDLQ